ncbi:MAG: ethanolamine ammonia-lyase reactivating factor EutA [Thiovulaceae bacterium]|nr:ethanolamine ammonia-lyase reactivating factor EutA [Sulfurimonadaceae bacterium]
MIAIDLGSNTLRCIAYDCQKKKWGKEYETVVRTADGLHVNKIINEKAINRVITALLEADRKLNFSSHKVVAFTTEAMRQAQNSAEVLEEIFTKTGVFFEIIDGEREATLATKAVKNRLDISKLSSSSFTLVDIGGGSTEIIFYKNGNLTSKSFNIGIVTLSESSNDIDEIQKNLDKLLIPVKEYISSYYVTYEKPEIFVQTAGTPTTIAAYLQNMNYHTYDASRINGYVLDQRGCQKTMDDLLAMDEQTRAFYVGVGREELIISGIIIVQKLYELLEYTSSVVIDDGLREGIALSYCEESVK